MERPLGSAPERTSRSPTAAIIAPLSVHSRGGGMRSSTPAASQRSWATARRRAFAATPPGSSLVIIAPHNPLPLLAQLRERAPIEVGYLKEEPEEWHVRITRLG